MRKARFGLGGAGSRDVDPLRFSCGGVWHEGNRGQRRSELENTHDIVRRFRKAVGPANTLRQ